MDNDHLLVDKWMYSPGPGGSDLLQLQWMRADVQFTPTEDKLQILTPPFSFDAMCLLPECLDELEETARLPLSPRIDFKNPEEFVGHLALLISGHSAVPDEMLRRSQFLNEVDWKAVLSRPPLHRISISELSLVLRATESRELASVLSLPGDSALLAALGRHQGPLSFTLASELAGSLLHFGPLGRVPAAQFRADLQSLGLRDTGISGADLEIRMAEIYLDRC